MMKKVLPLTLILAFLSTTLIAKDSVRFSGILGSMIYTMTQDGIVFVPMNMQNEDFDLAIDWTTTNPDMSIFTLDENYNYLPVEEGKTEAIWHKERVVFEHIYPNIDLIVHPPQSGRLTYEFVIYPGGDPSQVQLLSQPVSRGSEPVFASDLQAFQDQAGSNEEAVTVSFQQKQQSLGFTVGSYEYAQPLTIMFDMQAQGAKAKR